MSADNGIYIHKFKNGWKVAHLQAIDNIYWWNTESKNLKDWERKDIINPIVLGDMFANAEVFKTKEEAISRAFELLEEIGYVEYGVSEI